MLSEIVHKEITQNSLEISFEVWIECVVTGVGETESDTIMNPAWRGKGAGDVLWGLQGVAGGLLLLHNLSPWVLYLVLICDRGWSNSKAMCLVISEIRPPGPNEEGAGKYLDICYNREDIPGPPFIMDRGCWQCCHPPQSVYTLHITPRGDSAASLPTMEGFHAWRETLFAQRHERLLPKRFWWGAGELNLSDCLQFLNLSINSRVTRWRSFKENPSSWQDVFIKFQ